MRGTRDPKRRLFFHPLAVTFTRCRIRVGAGAFKSTGEGAENQYPAMNKWGVPSEAAGCEHFVIKHSHRHPARVHVIGSERIRGKVVEGAERHIFVCSSPFCWWCTVIAGTGSPIGTIKTLGGVCGGEQRGGPRV